MLGDGDVPYLRVRTPCTKTWVVEYEFAAIRRSVRFAFSIRPAHRANGWRLGELGVIPSRNGKRVSPASGRSRKQLGAPRRGRSSS
jgi:hypothetical protein